MATISGFYLTLLIMIIFNIVFNKSRSADILTFKYWIGKHELYITIYFKTNVLDIVMNSYSCVLNYNQIDYQAILHKEEKNKKNKEKKYHESTLIRQMMYFFIFFIMFLG